MINKASMAYKPTYQAAAIASPAIASHFEKLLAAALLQGGNNLAPEPSAKVIESIIDVTFWASLRREEGRSPKISLAYLPPLLAGQPLIFEERILLTPYVLTSWRLLSNAPGSTWVFGTRTASCMFGAPPVPYPIVVLYWRLLNRACW